MGISISLLQRPQRRGLFELGGGVPFTSEGQVLAGVGVSGGTTEQDIAIVEAAMR